jgi:isopenicillin N synthase-like dioxygenase
MEYRESFDISYLKGQNSIFPDDDVPDFRPAMLDLADKTKELTFRVLRSLALSLELVIFIHLFKRINRNRKEID